MPRSTTWSWPVQGHFAWTDLNHRFAESVFTYSAAFLDHYVKGDPASAELTRLRTDVSRLLYDSELGRRDRASP